MVPSERIQLFRWQFMPVEDARDGSIRWRWRAYTQNSNLAMQSKATFDTLTECIQDARDNGYGGQ